MKKEHEAKQDPKRPAAKTLTSNQGVNSDDISLNESIRNPPTEYRPEAHPEASRDQKYNETAEVADQVEDQRSSSTDDLEKRLPDLSLGETKRQALHAQDRVEADRKSPDESRNTLLLVEDNLINQKVLKRQLQGKGFEVCRRSTSQHA